MLKEATLQASQSKEKKKTKFAISQHGLLRGEDIASFSVRPLLGNVSHPPKPRLVSPLKQTQHNAGS